MEVFVTFSGGLSPDQSDYRKNGSVGLFPLDGDRLVRKIAEVFRQPLRGWEREDSPGSGFDGFCSSVGIAKEEMSDGEVYLDLRRIFLHHQFFVGLIPDAQHSHLLILKLHLEMFRGDFDGVLS